MDGQSANEKFITLFFIGYVKDIVLDCQTIHFIDVVRDMEK